MKAFTLIELLVVTAIIALLAAITFPVFAQAKGAAKSTTCLSQERQIGLVLGLYSNDYDDNAPTAGESGEGEDTTELNGESWLDDVQPYGKSRLIYRCPTDDSCEWDALISSRQTSYGLNAFFAPNHPPFYGFSLGRVAQPSNCVLVAELSDPVTEDHFSPMFWGDPACYPDPEKQKVQWDSSLQLPRTLALMRHAGGSNYLFVDLHVKKLRFEQLWRQTPGYAPSLDAFDPT